MLGDEFKIFIKVVAGGRQQHKLFGLFVAAGVYESHDYNWAMDTKTNCYARAS